MQTENLRVPALFATILAWVVLALSLTTAIGTLGTLAAYSQQASLLTIFMISGVAQLASLVIYPLSIIAVLVWIFTAHTNLHSAGLSGLNYSPGWATFSFFVPVANLFVPYKAMRELANRSAGEPEELAEADQQTVFAWWGCWIGSMIISHVLFYTFLITVVPGIYMTTPFWANQGLLIFGGILSAGSAFFLIKIIKQITQDQRDGASAAATFE